MEVDIKRFVKNFYSISHPILFFTYHLDLNWMKKKRIICRERLREIAISNSIEIKLKITNYAIKYSYADCINRQLN